MKRNYLMMLVAFVLTLTFASCKTSEANYKAAYDKARENKKESVGAEVMSRIDAENRAATAVIDGDSVKLLRMYASVPDASDAPSVKKYSVVVKSFKQVFNARTMRDRLKAEGHGSYVLYGGDDKVYMVAAEGFNTSSEANDYMKNLSKNVKMTIRKDDVFLLDKIGQP